MITTDYTINLKESSRKWPRGTESCSGLKLPRVEKKTIRKFILIRKGYSKRIRRQVVRNWSVSRNVEFLLEQTDQMLVVLWLVPQALQLDEVRQVAGKRLVEEERAAVEVADGQEEGIEEDGRYEVDEDDEKPTLGLK